MGVNTILQFVISLNEILQRSSINLFGTRPLSNAFPFTSNALRNPLPTFGDFLGGPYMEKLQFEIFQVGTFNIRSCTEIHIYSLSWTTNIYIIKWVIYWLKHWMSYQQLRCMSHLRRIYYEEPSKLFCIIGRVLEMELCFINSLRWPISSFQPQNQECWVINQSVI